MNKKIVKMSVIVLALSVLLSGCISLRKKPPVAPIPAPIDNNQQNNQGKGSVESQLAAQTKIKKFNSLAEYKEFLENTASSYVGGYGYGGGMRALTKESATDSAAPMVGRVEEGNAGSSESGQASPDYSKTNIQVEGVDEADIIKTDGKYVYAVSGNNLFIIEAYPAENASILSKIAFKSNPQDIYINGDFLAVYGQNYNIGISETGISETSFRMPRNSEYTFLKIFNIKDKKNPAQVKSLDFEGNYSNSRMIGDYIYFVTNRYSFDYNEETPFPVILKDGKEVLNKCSADKCVMPPIYYFDIPYENYNMTSVTAINIKEPSKDPATEIYVMSGNQNMYVSQNNIYITYTKYINEYQLVMEVMKEMVYPRLSAKDQEKIAKIEQTENYILSPAEKMAKIGAILERYSNSLSSEDSDKLRKETEEKMKQKYKDIAAELEKTVIHKIAIADGKTEYKTFGEVKGTVLNQFSMDEDGGYFRIATTKSQTWSQFSDNTNQESYSNLYVLDENLKIVGSLEKLAAGERIYSVRFMQGRAYMVTFEQTDPLFVIDLKDPNNPKILGQLKIPGFSNYLHPYDENTLIGIGKETGETEWGGVITKGIKLSLFDVSDVASPKEIDKYEMGDRGSDSIALSDHKAFLFSREKNLLVIPVTIMQSSNPNDYGKFSFSGAAVFKVDKTGFELKGKIDHSDGGKAGAREDWYGYDYYDNTVKRSLYINDILYTFSSKYLKANKIADLDVVKNLPLNKEQGNGGDDFEIVN
jgi:uncharacterized secreted protein with C-terminal beta-propeller domain